METQETPDEIRTHVHTASPELRTLVALAGKQRDESRATANAYAKTRSAITALMAREGLASVTAEGIVAEIEQKSVRTVLVTKLYELVPFAKFVEMVTAPLGLAEHKLGRETVDTITTVNVVPTLTITNVNTNTNA